MVKKRVRGSKSKSCAPAHLGPTYPEGAPQPRVAHFRMVLMYWDGAAR